VKLQHKLPYGSTIQQIWTESRRCVNKAYFFRLYALDMMLDVPPGASKSQVIEAAQGHVLAEAELMGRYTRA